MDFTEHLLQEWALVIVSWATKPGKASKKSKARLCETPEGRKEPYNE